LERVVFEQEQDSMKFWKESSQFGENCFDRLKVIAGIRTDDEETPEKVYLFHWQLKSLMPEAVDATGVDNYFLVEKDKMGADSIAPVEGIGLCQWLVDQLRVLDCLNWLRVVYNNHSILKDSQLPQLKEI
jgi:hypothetical protein